MTESIQQLADSLGADANSVNWLADYIAREYGDQIHDEASAVEAVRQGVPEWDKLQEKMAGDALEALTDHYAHGTDTRKGQKGADLLYLIVEEIGSDDPVLTAGV